MTITEKGEIYPEQKGLFIDGGVGGFNNPSMQALQVATLPSYGFGWGTGNSQLMMISVGTGWWRMRKDVEYLKSLWNWQKATEALGAMIQDTVLHTITAMQSISTPRKPWLINSEIERMEGQRIVANDVLSFQRFDAFIEADQVCRVCNIADATGRRAKESVEGLRQLGNTEPGNLASLYALGFDAGRGTRPGVDGVEAGDFAGHFDPPFMKGTA